MSLTRKTQKFLTLPLLAVTMAFSMGNEGCNDSAGTTAAGQVDVTVFNLYATYSYDKECEINATIAGRTDLPEESLAAIHERHDAIENDFFAYLTTQEAMPADVTLRHPDASEALGHRTIFYTSVGGTGAASNELTSLGSGWISFAGTFYANQVTTISIDDVINQRVRANIYSNFHTGTQSFQCDGVIASVDWGQQAAALGRTSDHASRRLPHAYIEFKCHQNLDCDIVRSELPAFSRTGRIPRIDRGRFMRPVRSAVI